MEERGPHVTEGGKCIPDTGGLTCPRCKIGDCDAGRRVERYLASDLIPFSGPFYTARFPSLP